MVDSEIFKNKIENILSQEYKIEFLGNNFSQIVKLMTDKKADSIYNWIKRIIDRDIQPILIGSKKSYKEWTIEELLTFCHKFSIGNVEYRILFVKVKNSIYIEFHLGNHKYYDKVRKELELKKTSY